MFIHNLEAITLSSTLYLEASTAHLRLGPLALHWHPNDS